MNENKEYEYKATFFAILGIILIISILVIDANFIKIL